MATVQGDNEIVYEVSIDAVKMYQNARKVQKQLDDLEQGAADAAKAVDDLDHSMKTPNAATASKNIHKVGEESRAASKELKKLNTRANEASAGFFKLSRVAAGLSLALITRQVSDYSNAWVSINNKLANSVKVYERLEDVSQRVVNIAQASHADLDATATLYSRLERSTREYNVSASDLARVTETINKGFAVSGATAAEAQGAMIQLSQGLASGVLRGQEFNSVAEQGSRIARALADSLGVSIGQLREMSRQGKLTTDVVLKALLSQSATIDKEFQNITLTLDQALNDSRTNLTRFIGESTTIKSAVSAFGSGLVMLTSNIDKVGLAIGAVSAIYAGKYINALTAAAAAQVQKVAGDYKEIVSIRQKIQAELQETEVKGKQLTAEIESLKAHKRRMAANGIEINITRELNALHAQRAVLIERESMLQVKLASATKLTTIAMRGLRSVYALLGGPAGILLLAAGALMTWVQNSNEAKASVEELGAQVEKLTQEYKSLNNEQRTLALSRLDVAIDNTTEKIKEQRREVEKAKRAMEEYGKAHMIAGPSRVVSVKPKATQQGKNLVKNDYLEQVNKLKELETNLAKATELRGKMTGEATAANDKMNESFKNTVQIGVDKKLTSIARQLDVANLKFEGNAKAAYILNGLYNALGESAEEYRDGLIELAKGQTVTAALTEKQVESLKPLVAQLGELFDKTQTTTKASSAQKSALQQLSEQLAVAKLQAKGLAAEAELLSLKQQAQTKITAQQAERMLELIKIKRAYAAISSFKSDEENEIEHYNEAKEALELLYQQKLYSQQQYNEKSEQLEAEHQLALARIRAEQAVTPGAEAVAQVDPVQALANEHARKLELIRQFEQQKLMTEQEALQLREAANYEFEQNRINAQWEIWRNQNETNDLLASTLDGLASSATSTFAGLISGSMSATEAMQNFAQVILNEAIGALVRMGLQYLQAAIMSQTAAEATTATQVAQAAELATAYQPAAMAASIATYGAAATAGAAAYTSSMGIMKAVSLVGGREHGGPVSAGSMYRVGEGNKPEIMVAGGRQYMIPGEKGKVLSNHEIHASNTQSAGTSAPTVIVNNYTNNEVSVRQLDDQTIIEIATRQAESNIADQLSSGSGSVARALQEHWKTNIRSS